VLVFCSTCTNNQQRGVTISHMISIETYGGTSVRILEKNINYLPLSRALTNITWHFTKEEYQSYLSEFPRIAVSIFGKVFDIKGNNTVFTGDYLSKETHVDFNKPHLSVRVNGTTPSSIQLDIEFTNPLSIPLTNVTVLVDGVHLNHTEVSVGTIGPEERILRCVWARTLVHESKKGVIYVKMTVKEMWGIQEIIETDF